MVLFDSIILKRIWLLGKLLLLLPVLFALLIACEDQIVSECELVSDATLTPRARYSDIQSNLFDVHCAFSGCHASVSPARDLDLTPGKSYAGLVTVRSLERPALYRVEPGSASNSFLLIKLIGEGTGVMPPSGQVRASLIDSVSAWIDAGAANN